MTTRRPSLHSSRRPTSAIFIGLPPPPSPPSPARSLSSTRSQLPSPPATNSGSTGDSNSTSAGSVRRTGMPNGIKHMTPDDDDDIVQDHDEEDDTAKFSIDRRAGKAKEADKSVSESSFSTLERVKSLTDRNRKVIDRLSSITSPDPHSRPSFSTPSAPSSSSSRSRSPLPPTFSSSSSSSTASTSSRVSFALSPHGGSGSETEREQRHPRDTHRQSSNDDDAATPPATTRSRTPIFDGNAPRQRLRSAPSSPAKPLPSLAQTSPRKYTSTIFTVLGSGRRSRRVSLQQPDLEEDEPPQPSQTASGSTTKRSRAPLPREFRDRRSVDGRSVGEGSTSARLTQDSDRTPSPGVFVARGAASPHSAGAGGTFSATPTSPRAQRPARASTVRDSLRRVQRWSSVDEATTNGDRSPLGEDGDGRRQWRNAGSAESPISGREARSVVGEGLRAAGLARRGSEDVFAEGVSQRRIRLSGGLGSRPSVNGSKDGDSDELRPGSARVGLGFPEEGRDLRSPAPGSVRFGTARNIHSAMSSASSRGGTSVASYGGEEDSTGASLRSYRTSYIPPERTSTRHTPQHERAHSSPYARTTPHLQTPSSEHARLMLESLTMFETQLARVPSSSSAPDLVRIALSVVQSANGLNTLLRTGNARALEAQIEAEVGDSDAQVDASEVWRQVGGEYRESLRVSDELVRTVTALLLGVGRLVREAVKEREAESPDVSRGDGEKGRSSLDGGERSLKTSRRSFEVDGRRSVDGHISRESRRSWEDTEGSMRRARVELSSRPSTSLSMTRDRDHATTQEDEGEETAREKSRSSTLDRLSFRRMFTRSRDTARGSPISRESSDPTSPTPPSASRESPENQRREHHRSLPALTVPPPLPSLPSESLLDRKGSARSRRSKFSNTSNATVRGTSIFPAVNSPNPTTALSTETVNAAGEVTSFPLLRTDTSPATALIGLQQQQERDVRTRAMSTTSVDGVSGSSASSSTRVLRSSRGRVSMDGGASESTSTSQEHPPAVGTGARRERRRTIDDVLPP